MELRSQTKAITDLDVAWETAESTEEEGEENPPPVRPKTTSPREAVSSAPTASDWMFAVMHDFLS